MESLQNEEQRRALMRFFKTQRPTDYGYGDEFLGLKNPQTRAIVKECRDLPLSEVPELLTCRWHEVRLCGFLIMVDRFVRNATMRKVDDLVAIRQRDEIVQMYLQYAERANNWDLVDLTAPKILGHWLLLPTFLGTEPDANGNRPAEPSLNYDYKIALLDELADSTCLWKQRMSVVCSWMTSQHGNPTFGLRYAERHLHHPHDLMHKAVGWMLREVGKRVSMDILRDFLSEHIHEMHRTSLRYAIELMPEDERQMWMKL